MQFVAAGEEFLRLFRPERVFHYGVVLVCTQDEAQGWVVPLGATFGIKVVGIKLKLPQVAMRQLANLEIDQHKTFQNGVIENEIDYRSGRHRA